jgi:hypothetical protein
MLMFAGGLGTGAWWLSESLMLKQTVSEGRTVADMVENIGKWASQYGGVHVRTQGANAKIPGNFLTRSVYSISGSDNQVLQGSKVEAAVAERDALERVEAYHWKNPALIQREVADVIAASGSKARYRLTARTVLNKNNAPDTFEREALDAVQAAANTKTDAPTAQEYWRVSGGRLLYARSEWPRRALRCHKRQRAGIHPHQCAVQWRRRLWLRGRQACWTDQRLRCRWPACKLQRKRCRPRWAALGLAGVGALWMLVLAFRRR